MTPAQRQTLTSLPGFAFVEAGELVRVTRNADKRVIMPDGTQKRGHHVAPGVLKR